MCKRGISDSPFSEMRHSGSEGKKDVFKIGQVIQEEIKRRISDQNEIVSKGKMDRIDRN